MNDKLLLMKEIFDLHHEEITNSVVKSILDNAIFHNEERKNGQIDTYHPVAPVFVKVDTEQDRQDLIIELKKRQENKLYWIYNFDNCDWSPANYEDLMKEDLYIQLHQEVLKRYKLFGGEWGVGHFIEKSNYLALVSCLNLMEPGVEANKVFSLLMDAMEWTFDNNYNTGDYARCLCLRLCCSMIDHIKSDEKVNKNYKHDILRVLCQNKSNELADSIGMEIIKTNTSLGWEIINTGSAVINAERYNLSTNTVSLKTDVLSDEQIVELVEKNIIETGTDDEMSSRVKTEPSEDHTIFFRRNDAYYLVEATIAKTCIDRVQRIFHVYIEDEVSTFDKSISNYAAYMNLSNSEKVNFAQQKKKEILNLIGDEAYSKLGLEVISDYKEEIEYSLSDLYFPKVYQATSLFGLPGTSSKKNYSTKETLRTFFEKKDVIWLRTVACNMQKLDVLSKFEKTLQPTNEDEVDILTIFPTIVNKYVLLDQLGIIQFLKDKYNFDAMKANDKISLISMILGLESKGQQSIKGILNSPRPTDRNYPLKDKNLNAVWSELTKIGIVKPVFSPAS